MIKPYFTHILMAFLCGSLFAADDLPRGPIPAINLVEAVPFRLAQPYTHHWRAENPRVDKGMVLVIEVAPNLVLPRQTMLPVLYVGDQTAEPINQGHLSGYLIVLVPNLDEAGLATAPIWFGGPDLPERVGEQKISRERRDAEANQISAFDEIILANARQNGGQTIEAPHKPGLLAALLPMVRQYAPGESDLIKSLELRARQ